MVKNNALRTLAEQAKRRMKSGNYSEITKTHTSNYTNSYFYKNLSAIKRKVGKVRFTRIDDEVDENFYNRVFKLLVQNEDIINPIGVLSDPEIFDKLSGIEKQCYILKLMDRYLRAKERYFAFKNASKIS